MPFYRVRETLYKQKREGVQIKSLSGEDVQLTLIRLEPGFVSEHKHPEEQIGYVMSGNVEIAIGGEKMACGVGDGYLIPGDTIHAFRVLSNQPVELVEAFSPPKEENKI